MARLKILDFDYTCGGFTKGLEDTKKFKVVDNLALNKKNNFCYNKIHSEKMKFPEENKNSEKIKSSDDFDLSVFTPNLGYNFSKKGNKNFNITELNNYLAFISLKLPENLIIITKRDAFPFLQQSNNVCRINDNLIPTKDIVSNTLVSLGYNVYNFVIDEAGFGVPQHIFFNFYWASLNDIDSLNIKEGYGHFKRKYRTVKNAIGDITDDTKLSWHKPNYSKIDVCRLIPPGGRASRCKEVSQSQGYIRLAPDEICSHLNNDFYIPSSNHASINPWFDRALTIREGARLFGLSDDFDWNPQLSKKEVALLIYESFSPMVSKLMGLRLYKFLK